MSNPIQLNQEQQDCINQFKQFITTPFKPENDYLVISGAAGTGKSTILKYMVDAINELNKVNQVIDLPNINIQVTATTHKAVDIISAHFNPVSTIHNTLSLYVATDENKSKLYQTMSKDFSNTVIFVDECSYIDSDLMKFIQATQNVKWVFMGDEAQLPPVGEKLSKVFTSGFPIIRLNKVMRQADDNKIQEYSLQLRNYIINKGEFPRIYPNDDIVFISKKDFEKEVNSMNPKDVVLSYTNLGLSRISAWISSDISTDKTYQPSLGDYVELHTKKNKAVNAVITSISKDRLSTKFWNNVPYTTDWKEYKETTQTNLVFVRSIQANTIHKAQGSTYNNVYLYLPDLNKCRDMDLKLRLLYVAISRARNKVILTGDLSCPS